MNSAKKDGMGRDWGKEGGLEGNLENRKSPGKKKLMDV